MAEIQAKKILFKNSKGFKLLPYAYTSMDLSDYYTKKEVDEKFDSIEELLKEI